VAGAIALADEDFLQHLVLGVVVLGGDVSGVVVLGVEV